ncbi:MAG: proton-conducting transporter membrane subunit [Gammaproteobacteria bacterium]|nr:proton-conducting transporter membrane subunit [Gammaproteobacteria bacterium]
MSAELAILASLALPLAGAVLIAFAGRIGVNVREAATMLIAGALALIVWSLVPAVAAGERPQVSVAEVLPGIELAFAVEPLGMLFAALASMLWIVNSLYSIGYMRGNEEANQTRFYALFAVSLGATVGVAFAANLFTLFLFYEVLTLSTYPLVAHKGDRQSVASARVYLVVLLSTSIVLFLPAIIWTYLVAGSGDFTLGGVLAGKLEGAGVGVLLLLFVFGIGKAAVMPVHPWLPAAMVAPTPVSALLHAVAVVKAGVFAITKVIIYIFGVEHLAGAFGADLLVFIAAFTIIAASIVALRQTNLKRLLAYSTVAQLSYVVMAIALLTPLAGIGAAVHIVAHAFGKITLFFAAGAIYTAAHKTEITELRGIGRRMPVTMMAFTIGALSMIGVPPTGGFVSKWYILAGAYQADSMLALVTILASTVLNAAYLLPIIYLAWFAREDEGDGTPPARVHGEAPWPAVLALGLTAALTVGFFVFHGAALDIARQLLAGF